jgi:5-methylcytosine-specific restriction endonuclease McrA
MSFVLVKTKIKMKSSHLKHFAKNTLQSRKTSIQYYVANSLHNIHTPSEYLNTGCNVLMNSNTCIYCGIEFSTYNKSTIDHIYPLIIDGVPSKRMVFCYQNFGLCCSSCNSSKSNRCHIQWMTNKKYCVQRLNLINKQISFVPTFSDEIYNLIITKYETFMKNHMNGVNELMNHQRISIISKSNRT